MVMKRIALLLAAATIILTLATSISVMWFAKGDPLKAKFDRVRKGMTEAEVEAIFENDPCHGWSTEGRRSTKIWQTQSSEVGISFLESKVVERYYIKQSDSPMDKILVWLGIKGEIELYDGEVN